MGLFKAIKNFLGIKEYKLPDRTLEDLKQLCRILFIDDQSFKVIQILKNAGWSHTKCIRDVDSLDSLEVAEAHIIFVDIHDVGRKLGFKDEGLGLIMALRQKYPFKKLVVYSAERSGDRFHQGFSAADARLAKNADPFEFQTLVEQYSQDAFSLSECIARLKRILSGEFGVYLNETQIVKNMTSLMKKGDYSVDAVGGIFNLNNAAAVAQIISLFLTGK
jgi:hypothetical protein